MYTNTFSLYRPFNCALSRKFQVIKIVTPQNFLFHSMLYLIRHMMYGLFVAVKLMCFIKILACTLICCVVHICDTITGEWVACWQYSIFIFQFKLFVHLKGYILIQTHLNRTSGCRYVNNSYKFLNNEKHKNLSPLSAYNSKSIFPTSDSFPWSCHIYTNTNTLQPWACINYLMSLSASNWDEYNDRSILC